MIRYIPLQEMDDSMWQEAHKAFFSLELNREMGGGGTEVLPLQDFYNSTMDEIEAGNLVGWAIADGEEYLGHMLLVRPQGEWEVGVALASKERRGSGIGVRACLYALRYAFEELGAQQVIAFAHNPNGVAGDMLLRGGFVSMFHFLYMNRDMWRARWGGRV